VVAIGASTGGPPALATILRELPVDLDAAVLVVQHMAEGFLDGLARWLDEASPLDVKVAEDGDRLQAGRVYLAPAGRNMLLRPGYRLELAEPAVGQFHVPGVDATFHSVARVCGRRAVGVLLTGMGRDGAVGLQAMRHAGAGTIGQDESTCVVYGMPAAARALGAVDAELPLTEVAPAVAAAVQAIHEPTTQRSAP
jgi:chemotaxis response regulator CheB